MDDPTNTYSTKLTDGEIIDRLRDLYSQIVDETENPEVIHNSRLNAQLSYTLELLEFIQGSDDYKNAAHFITDNF